MDEAKVKYRHELKYVSSEMELALVKGRLDHLISLDSHVKEKGIYSIRSLYFDDYDGRCYDENESGSDPREKFRIRIYNAGTGRISLELKRKEHGMTQKLSCRLTEEQCRELMVGRPIPMDPSYPPVLQKLNLQMRTRLLRPRIIVEYDRIPYVDPLGNTRITLDLNIRSSSYTSLFLTEQPPMRPIMPKGRNILEVKYDEFLPDYISRNLQLDSLQQTAYSKYYLCRRYSFTGIPD